MERSVEIADLAAALAKAQGEIEDAPRDRANPQFQSKYASLARVRAALRAPLSANGLSYVQLCRVLDHAVEVETVLLHQSGQFLSETLRIPPAEPGPQAIGSAITYGRRYGLMSMVGIAASDDDDDAERAEGRGGAESTMPTVGATGGAAKLNGRAQLPPAARKPIEPVGSSGFQIQETGEQLQAARLQRKLRQLARNGRWRRGPMPRKSADERNSHNRLGHTPNQAVPPGE